MALSGVPDRSWPCLECQTDRSPVCSARHAHRTGIKRFRPCTTLPSHAGATPAAFFSVDSHDDFKAQPVQGAPQDVVSMIKEDIAKNNVMLYMKVPHDPLLPFPRPLARVPLVCSRRARRRGPAAHCRAPAAQRSGPATAEGLLHNVEGLLYMCTERETGSAGDEAGACRGTPNSQCVASVQGWSHC